MKNREVFLRDPASIELLNNGVAKVTDGADPAELRTLRHELKTFVCEGEYEKGLRHVLRIYLENLSKTEQPGVWVSGFYGSGKSHFVKMLRALWTDVPFAEHHDTPRGLVELPQDIRDLFVELSSAGRRSGGLHAAAGTLGAGTESVRLALLAIIFRSMGLPEQYDRARFILWLREKGALDAVRADIESRGFRWNDLLPEFVLDPSIAEAVSQHVYKSSVPPSEIPTLLERQFPLVRDVSNGDMLETLSRVLAPDGRFPCTLLALDEVQQYIGSSTERALTVQEVTEACGKHFGSKLLLIGTGQTAMATNDQLLRLRGRFPVSVQLSDTDVDTVIRKIVLQKKTSALPELDAMFARHGGEVSRHLAGTSIEHRPADNAVLALDYPLLPVRRRLWSRVLRAVDNSGTVAQLRNQLKAVFDAVRSTADEPIGHVIGAEFLYTDIAALLLQTAVLPREVHELVQRFRERPEDPDDLLRSRVVSLVFLLGKLPRTEGRGDDVRATADTLADLLVEDLTVGSGALRARIPRVLDDLVERAKLMRVDDEYRVQTHDSVAWEASYQTSLRAWLSSGNHQLETARSETLQTAVADALAKVVVLQGQSKVKRSIAIQCFTESPVDDGEKITVWVRSGWRDTEASFREEAIAAGDTSPVVFVYLPSRSAEDFHRAIASYKAAQETLDKRGEPTTPEAIEARNAVRTRRDMAERRTRALLDEIIAEARVYQGGGSLVPGVTLADAVRVAVGNALVRRFPQFAIADHVRWSAVCEKVRTGQADALEHVGYKGDVEKHPVCIEVLRFVANGRRGGDVRTHFEGPPWGFAQDAIDGALLVLALTEHLRVSQNGSPVPFAQLDRKRIGIVDFRAETVPVTAAEKMAVRKLLQEAGVACKPGDELIALPLFLTELRRRAEAAGGDAPRPERPSVKHLDELARMSGNSLLKGVLGAQETLRAQLVTWSELTAALAKRLPRWQRLEELLALATELPDVAPVRAERDAVHAQRRLLADPDPIVPACEVVVTALRTAVTAAREAYEARWREERDALEATLGWQSLTNTQRAAILQRHGVEAVPIVAVGTEDELLSALRQRSLSDWRHLRDALPQRFANARIEAAKVLEPEVVEVRLPRATLRTNEDLERWLDETRRTLAEKLARGPVIV